MINCVFELRDVTNDEIYFPIGMFQSVEEAEKAIVAVESKDHPISWYQDGGDKESLVLVKIPFGIGNEYQDHQEVLKIIREEDYDKEKDCFYWKRI